MRPPIPARRARRPARAASLVAPVLALGLGLGAVRARAVAAPAAALTVEVDLTDAPRHVLHVREVIRVRPGPLELVYPRWIPGEHGPTGQAVGLAGLVVTARGEPLAWTRDPLDMNSFRVTVPAEVETIAVSFDHLAPAGGSFGASPSTSPSLAALEWCTVLLVPRSVPPAELRVAPRVRLPAGWKLATALSAARAGAVVELETVSLERLIDSPLVAGAHRRTVTLDERHRVELVADSAEALEVRSETVAAWRRLVAEAGALFAVRPYRRYVFLVALSDAIASFGLEHHESSDNRMPERALVDDAVAQAWVGLLPHEFVHSWNGKHRRPTGMIAADFQAPIRTELLWVYEGLTQYLGVVLTARAGLRDVEATREGLAFDAAYLDSRAGRAWRPLVDTAVAAQDLFGAPAAGRSWRRGVDFYDEGTLIWLEADARIRQATGGARSLDDFLRLFLRGASEAPAVRPYDEAELLALLGQVAGEDWRGFFSARVQAVAPRAPVGGLEAAGWRLVYDERPNRVGELLESADRILWSTGFSLGATLDLDGNVVDVAPGTPAARAGLAPGERLLAVGGRRWSTTRLKTALREAKGGRPLELVVEDGDFVRVVRLDYRGGERHPHLERIAGRPDLLSEILAPTTSAAARAGTGTEPGAGTAGAR